MSFRLYVTRMGSSVLKIWWKNHLIVKCPVREFMLMSRKFFLYFDTDMIFNSSGNTSCSCNCKENLSLASCFQSSLIVIVRWNRRFFHVCSFISRLQKTSEMSFSLSSAQKVEKFLKFTTGKCLTESN